VVIFNEIVSTRYKYQFCRNILPVNEVSKSSFNILIYQSSLFFAVSQPDDGRDRRHLPWLFTVHIRRCLPLVTVAYINDNGVQITAQQRVVHQLFHMSAIRAPQLSVHDGGVEDQELQPRSLPYRQQVSIFL